MMWLSQPEVELPPVSITGTASLLAQVADNWDSTLRVGLRSPGGWWGGSSMAPPGFFEPAG